MTIGDVVITLIVVGVISFSFGWCLDAAWEEFRSQTAISDTARRDGEAEVHPSTSASPIRLVRSPYDWEKEGVA